MILPTSMLIMNFRNRAGEDPKEVTANLFRLFILVQLLSTTELEQNACYVRRLEFRRIKSIAENTQQEQEQEPGKTCGSFRARSIRLKTVPTGPTGKSGPPQKLDQFTRNFFRLDRTDPLSFGPKFPEILVQVSFRFRDD